jgi:two-component system phosphate regulon sensor histidine kinase PhoR
MLEKPLRRFDLTQFTLPTGRTDSTPLLVAAGGLAGLAAVVALGVFGGLEANVVAAAFVFVALATGASLLLANRSAEARFNAVMRAAADQANEPPPYAALINALPDPILVISATEPDDLTSRRYIFANSAARELLRIQRGEGLLVGVIRDPQVLEAVDGALFDAQDTETLYSTVGAQPRTLRAQVRPLGLALDGRRLAVLVFRDETHFHQVERTRADFLANASHELRTPLATLSGFIETLRGHAKDDAGARERFLSIMQAQAGRMSRLIDDLMSLSRIELNEHVAPADEVDLALCVSDVLDAMTPLARERDVTLEPAIPPRGVARVVGDRDQIVQVVQNLIDNALKYSPAGGVVRIGVEGGLSADVAAAGVRPQAARLTLLTPDHAGETYAALRVSDQGAGIARENLPRLTERFYRVEGQKSGERSGTGLGLAIVKHITNRHRGGLVVESAPGQGTTFTAYFPLAVTAAIASPIAVAKVS